MLLGRNVLKRRFLVNSSASFQLGGSRNTPPARGE
jgi:hypothetical protein